MFGPKARVIFSSLFITYVEATSDLSGHIEAIIYRQSSQNQLKLQPSNVIEILATDKKLNFLITGKYDQATSGAKEYIEAISYPQTYETC